jgi:hypothetical protein
MEIQERPFANILSDTPCPEDQSVGCESCSGDDDCKQEIHDTFKCWELELFGLKCEICEKLKDQKEN